VAAFSPWSWLVATMKSQNHTIRVMRSTMFLSIAFTVGFRVPNFPAL
jgi:hypothetical protein